MRQIRNATLASLAVLAAACTPVDQAEGGPASAPVAAASAPAAAPAPAPTATVAAVAAPAPATAPAPAPAPAPTVAAAVVDQAAGKALFNDWSCGTCHTLAAAGGTGGVGPSFDGNARLTFDYAKGVITNGQGAMPAFGGQMTDAEIATISAYIVATKK